MLEEARTDPVLDLRHRVTELLGDSLALQRVDGVRVRRCGHDDEGNDGRLAACLLQTVVQASEGLDEHVHTLRDGDESVSRVRRVVGLALRLLTLLRYS